MNNFFKSYLGGVITAWLLVVAGMGIGGMLCPGERLYPLFISLGLVPAAVFIGWASGDASRRIWLAVLFVIVTGIGLSLAHWMNLAREYGMVIPLVVVIACRSLLTRTQRNKEAQPPASAPSFPRNGGPQRCCRRISCKAQA